MHQKRYSYCTSDTYAFQLEVCDVRSVHCLALLIHMNKRIWKEDELHKVCRLSEFKNDLISTFPPFSRFTLRSSIMGLT